MLRTEILSQFCEDVSNTKLSSMFFNIFLNGTSDGSLVFSHENVLLANLLYCAS